LNQLWKLYLTGQIDLYFGDESGFSMNPCLAYGWQAKGEQIGILARKDKKINVLGMFRADNHCVTYCQQENINSAFVIKCIDDFCQYIDKPTVLVLDNAPTHRSKAFQGQLERWQEKDLFIFFLPTYSPHLNKAETYWRKAKYEWIKPLDYLSFTAFQNKIKYIFNHIGLLYRIEFKELSVL